jgi:hypothetical protein
MSADPMAKVNHEEQSRQALIGQAKKINWAGHDVLEAEKRVAARAAAVAEHEARHPDLTQLHSSVIIKYVIVGIALVCIYLLDLLLFGGTAEYLATLITGNPILVILAKFGVPLFFLVVEVLISIKIIDAREEVQAYGWSTNRMALILWIALGVLVALVMPLTAVGTAIAVQTVADDSVPLVMLVILAIISFACHVLILFGGKLAHAAKTYGYFAAKHTKKTGERDVAQGELQHRVKKLENLFIPYVHHWRKHNATYSYVEAGPFDNDVAELLRRLFPYIGKNGRDGDADA